MNRNFNQLPQVQDPTQQDPGLISKGLDLLKAGKENPLAVVACAAAIGGGAFLSTELGSGDNEAYAQSAPATVTITQENAFAKFGSSQMSESDVASAKVTFLENIKAKGMPTKVHQRLERAGNCKTVDGRKQVLYSQGHDVNSMSQYGRDLRTSRVCFENGKWIRVKCGNIEIIKHAPPKPPVPGKVVWVKSFANASIKLHADVTAKAAAECHSPDNAVAAIAYGEGSARADVQERLKAFVKAKGNSLISLTGSMEGKASATASAKAIAFCAEQNRPAETVTVTTTQTTTTSTTPTKDGSTGAGSGTTGTTSTGSTVGGTGSGGTAGNTTEMYPCYDTNDSSNGDLNPNTSGATMYSSTQPDQFGYCVGPAKATVNG